MNRNVEIKKLAEELKRSLEVHHVLRSDSKTKQSTWATEFFNSTNSSLTEVSRLCLKILAGEPANDQASCGTLREGVEILSLNEPHNVLSGFELQVQTNREAMLFSMRTILSKLSSQKPLEAFQPFQQRTDFLERQFIERIVPWLYNVVMVLDSKVFKEYKGDTEQLPMHIASLSNSEAFHLSKGLNQLLSDARKVKVQEAELANLNESKRNLESSLTASDQALKRVKEEFERLTDQLNEQELSHNATLEGIRSQHQNQISELNKQIAELQASLTSSQTSLSEEQAHSRSLTQELESARVAEAASRDIINRAKLEISMQLGLSAEMPLNELTNILIHRGSIADLMEGVNWRRTLPTLEESLAALQADLSSYPFLSDKVKHLAAEQIHEMERRLSSGVKYLEQLESGAFGQNQALEIRDATICRQPIWVEPDKASHKSSTESIALSYVNSVMDVAGADVYSHLLSTLGLEQVSPNQGEPYDAVLHQSSGKEPWPRPAAAEIGSVAAVRRPGIKKGGRLYVKADVYLYGEALLPEEWKEAASPTALRSRQSAGLQITDAQLSLQIEPDAEYSEMEKEQPSELFPPAEDLNPQASAEGVEVEGTEAVLPLAVEEAGEAAPQADGAISESFQDDQARDNFAASDDTGGEDTSAANPSPASDPLKEEGLPLGEAPQGQQPGQGEIQGDLEKQDESKGQDQAKGEAPPRKRREF